MNLSKAELESKLSAVAGRPVEITIRGDESVPAFTFSYEGTDPKPAEKIVAFFGDSFGGAEVVSDAECDATFVYLGNPPKQV